MKKKNSSTENMISHYFVRLSRMRLSLALICLILLLLLTVYLSWISMLSGIIAGLALLILYAVTFIDLIPRYAKTYSCRMENKYVLIQQGIIMEKTIKIPYEQIQYCVISQDIFQRMFRVCSVKMLMAGSSHIVRHVPFKEGRRIRHRVEAALLRKEAPHER